MTSAGNKGANMEIPRTTARRLAVWCQGLDGLCGPAVDPPDGLDGAREDTARAIERIGYVQIDTISVIERAHHHVLWTRCPEYHPPVLDDLLARRMVFEWWTHAASYIPLTDFRFYAPRMGVRALSDSQKAWAAENQEVVDYVLARIREEGPLGSGDFDAPEGWAGGSWWSGWKPAKRALEVLFNMGVVMVSERRNFQRLYDLSERVVPEEARGPQPDQAELHDFVIRRTVGALGVLPVSEIRWWWRTTPSEASLRRAEDAGLITSVMVAGNDGEPWVAWTVALDAVNALPETEPHLYVLSPFDNLIIRRRWMERVFGFRYSLEAYLPKEKRTYGYFVLPILWGDRFIGRMDAKADRRSGTLLVHRLTFEPDFDAYEAVLGPLVEKLTAFAAFNGCDAIEVVDVEPACMMAPLSRCLG